jgi:peptidylprolyl isomerase
VRRLAAVVLIGLLALVACGSDTKTASGSSGSSSSTGSELPSSASLDVVKVDGAIGEKPTVSFPKPFSVAASARRVLIDGDGPEVAEGDTITVDYYSVNGTDNAELGMTYGATPTKLTLDRASLLPGMVSGLVGIKVGSRVLVAVAPVDGFGADGSPQAKIGPNDTLLFVFDVKEIRHVLARAEGAAVTPAAGLPTVSLDSTGKPTITVPSSAPSATLVTQPLIKGGGAVVAAGQTVTVHYTGVVYATGKQFDSSWDRGKPVGFSIGTGNVIPGWDEAIVGQTVGSQLLLVIPPDKGYGAAGNSQAGIGGTDTLVFVVDVLDAA